MFYNLSSVYQSLFIFTLSKFSYSFIYKSNDSSSKIVSIIMCALGSCTAWSLLYSKINNKQLIDNEDDENDENNENDEKINDYTKRTDISNVMNDVDRLLGESKTLGQKY